MAERKAAPRICLAASGGGHLRQLMQMREFWSEHDRFFVTEDTALGRSLAAEEQVEFVPHFALGQVRLGRLGEMLRNAWRSLWQSRRIIAERKPAWVVTTGAGSQIFIVLWARLAGARIVLIDSFARFHAPSGFARVARRLAHHVYAQSESVGTGLHADGVFDPLQSLAGARPIKEPLLFATVGATLPFARLETLVRGAKSRGEISDNVILQNGTGDGAEQQGVTAERVLTAPEISNVLNRSRIVICHGGTGSILSALEQHCHVIVIPRRAELGEHYDDHQSEIAEVFAGRGLVQVAHDADELARCLKGIETREPVAVTSDYGALVAELSRLIAEHGPR